MCMYSDAAAATAAEAGGRGVDARSSARPRRRGMSPEECRSFISDRMGTNFDPDLSEKFLFILKT